MKKLTENKSKKIECIYVKKNEMKKETNDEKHPRFIFEACELLVSNPNSDTEFDTVYEQCSSEKKQKSEDKKWRQEKLSKLIEKTTNGISSGGLKNMK